MCYKDVGCRGCCAISREIVGVVLNIGGRIVFCVFGLDPSAEPMLCKLDASYQGMDPLACANYLRLLGQSPPCTSVCRQSSKIFSDRQGT